MKGGGLSAGKNALLLEMFKTSDHETCYIPCFNEKQAEELRNKYRGLGWCEAKVIDYDEVYASKTFGVEVKKTGRVDK